LNYYQVLFLKKNHKCEVCIESKFTKPFFKTIKKSSEPLDLIHSDINNLNFIHIRSRKKHYITFIYNYKSIVIHIYLEAKIGLLNSLNITTIKLK
jgi:hypothetical protein